MNVGLDEARDQERAAGVDDAVDTLRRGHGADSGNAPVAYQHVTFDDVEGVVHGDDAGVAND